MCCALRTIMPSRTSLCKYPSALNQQDTLLKASTLKSSMLCGAKTLEKNTLFVARQCDSPAVWRVFPFRPDRYMGLLFILSRKNIIITPFPPKIFDWVIVQLVQLLEVLKSLILFCVRNSSFFISTYDYHFEANQLMGKKCNREPAQFSLLMDCAGFGANIQNGQND